MTGSVHTRSVKGGEVFFCIKSLALWVIRKSPAKDLRVRLILKQITEKYSEVDLSTSDLAKEARLSGRQLARLFKREIGMTPKHYLRLVRLLKAAELLNETVLSIKEIASDVGYMYVSNFDHNFLGFFRLSPSQYRDSVWQEDLHLPVEGKNRQ